jgi:aspartate ammonia-lyase
MRIKNRGVKKTRTEKDFLGEVRVPAEVYYSIQTARALENFPVSGLKEHAAMIKAMALIKKSAARANSDLGRLDKKRAAAIVRACDEISVGRFDDQFVVDVFQMGAGTSFHMNINEVVANRASEIMGGVKGEAARVATIRP